MWKRKRKIILSGLCISLLAVLAVCLGILGYWGTPPFEISKVYSLPLGENEKVSVRRIVVSNLTSNRPKEILMSYDVASYVEQEVEGGTAVKLIFKEARILILSSDTGSTFQKLWEYDSGLTRQTVAVGDLDADGKLDMVVGGVMTENVGDSPQSMTCRMEILLQRKDGSFDLVSSSGFPGFFGLGLIEAGDFDGDGRTDLVASGFAGENESPYHAYLFQNEGGGNFTMSPIALRERIIVEDMWKADIDGDRSLDLVIRATDLDSETHSLFLLLNDGRGEFEFRELDVSPDVMIIEDFTEDGYPDIIYTEAGPSGDEAYLLRNDHGEFTKPKSIDIQGERRIVGMISADFDNDNTPDVFLLEENVEFRKNPPGFVTDTTGHLLVVKQTADGELTFARECSYKFLEGEHISSPYAMEATDANDDGLMDLILVGEYGRIYLALNQQP